MKTSGKRYLGQIPVTSYLPKDVAEWVASKAAREALAPGTWVRKMLSLAFENERDHAMQQQQAYMAAMMQRQGSA